MSKDAEKIKEDQLRQAQSLGEQFDVAMGQLTGAKKLGSEKRIRLLGQLVRAHSELVKTQRTITGLDQVGGTINAGVIVIQGKEDPNEWAKVASHELKKAKKLVDSSDNHSQVKQAADSLPAGQAVSTAEEGEEP